MKALLLDLAIVCWVALTIIAAIHLIFRIL
jgi:hypothetical protein